MWNQVGSSSILTLDALPNPGQVPNFPIISDSQISLILCAHSSELILDLEAHAVSVWWLLSHRAIQPQMGDVAPQLFPPALA